MTMENEKGSRSNKIAKTIKDSAGGPRMKERDDRFHVPEIYVVQAVLNHLETERIDPNKC